MLEKTEEIIKNGQSRDTGNIGLTKTQDEDNPETLATLGSQDTGRRQFRDTGNIGLTRHRTKTIQRHWQHWAHKTQDEDKQKHNTTQKMGNTDPTKNRR
jgi:hypothetical protein